MKKTVLFIAFALYCATLFPQPAERLVKVVVSPNSADWNYKLGEKVTFDIAVTKNNLPLKDASVRYELSYDMMTPFKTESKVLKDGKVQVSASGMKVPGFLRCRVFVDYDDVEYTGMATAGYEPEKIKPTAVMPSDFTEFWDKVKKDNESIPMNPTLRFLADKSNEKADVYELRVQNFRQGSYIYGILSVPKTEGKYPALLKVPGAGVRSYGGNVVAAEEGVITLEIGIHGVSVTMENYVYNDLRTGALSGYQTNNWDDKDQVYYKRVYAGCVRAVDYIFSMEKFDGENLVVSGGSQGGALAIVTAALDSRVKQAVAFYPALSDLNGYRFDRAGGWPHLFKNTYQSVVVIEQKMKNTAYYDVVNFARIVKVPVFYALGYNDMVCPPTSMFSAYNVISSPVTLHVVPEIGHYTYPEMWAKASEFAKTTLKKQIRL